MKLLNPFHNLLLIASSAFFIAAFFTLKKTLDINLYDVTYVIPFAQIFMASAVYLAIVWLLYTFTFKRLFSKKLYKFHIIFSIILFVLIMVAALWSNQWIAAYAEENTMKFSALTIEVGRLIVGALVTLLLIQLLYPINLIIGYFKKN